MVSSDVKTQTEIDAVNQANALAMKVYDMYSVVFSKYVGQKIEKADGTILKKIKDELEEIPMFCYKYQSCYSLLYIAKVCVQNSDHVCYHESSCYIGEMRNGILVKLSERPVYRTDYTFTEIQDKREKLKIAEKAFSDAKSNLYPFSEYSR